ncbi:uncharacterized protein LOC111088797 [Limulus polyphemus]|uniref:Uncharacterized protein LOC111088797 n=1 Tax=Limulus polyphemus TaxID=6850 RepID=A0ABM1TI15_LIMPO|nr:uncharacterized protein LOC111088797 [Limulus polyphemus]
MAHNVFKENICDTLDEKILLSPRSAIKAPDVTWPEFIYQLLEKNGDKIFVVAHDNSSSYTYKEVAFYSRRFASALIRQGLEPGDVFCICTSHNIDFPIVFLGAVSAGAVIVLGKPYETESKLLDGQEGEVRNRSSGASLPKSIGDALNTSNFLDTGEQNGKRMRRIFPIALLNLVPDGFGTCGRRDVDGELNPRFLVALMSNWPKHGHRPPGKQCSCKE